MFRREQPLPLQATWMLAIFATPLPKICHALSCTIVPAVGNDGTARRPARGRRGWPGIEMSASVSGLRLPRLPRLPRLLRLPRLPCFPRRHRLSAPIRRLHLIPRGPRHHPLRQPRTGGPRPALSRTPQTHPRLRAAPKSPRRGGRKLAAMKLAGAGAEGSTSSAASSQTV